MKEVKYNPFGSTENEYVYNAAKARRDGKKTPWGKIVIIFVISCLLIAYIITFMSARQMKSDADAAIDNFNESIATVHDTFTDPSLPQELRDTADETEEKIGGENEQIKATRLLANVIGHFEDTSPVFDKHGEREKEAVKIAPYYAACDLSVYALDTSAIDHKTMCGEFTEVAQNMMKSVRMYNLMTEGILGKITFHNDTYVDIMNKPGETVPEPSPDVPVESGEVPPQD